MTATREPQHWHIYMVRTGNGALYTGIATDVPRRLAEHARGGARGARALRGSGPLQLAYQMRLGTRALALRAEARLKRLRKPGKERIVADAPDSGRLLSLLGLETPVHADA